MRKIAGLLIVSAIISTNLLAQERNDVINVFNEGAKAMQTDIPTAIQAFEKVVTMSDQVGESVDDLKQKAVKVLPGLYVKLAVKALNDKAPASEVISSARTALAASVKYGSETNKANSEKVLVQGYNSMAAEFFANNDYENALVTFDSLLAINPDYLNAIYNKALIYIRQDNSASFEETIDLFIDKVKGGNDEEKVKQASTLALEYFRSKGSVAIQDEKLDEAIGLLTKSAKYGDDKDLFYFFADAYNKKSDFETAAGYAQKGLDLEPGDAEAKAKFYYQLAVAQLGMGKTSEACESFKNAQYGAFTEAAKAQRTNLKCE